MLMKRKDLISMERGKIASVFLFFQRMRIKSSLLLTLVLKAF